VRRWKQGPGALDARNVVDSLYATLLDRATVGDETRDKIDYLEGGGTVEQVIEWIMTSEECRYYFYCKPVFQDIVAPEALPQDEPRLYVWHLPKTGGTSLKEMLRPHVDGMEFCGDLTFGEVFRLSNYRLRSFRVIAGHFGPTLPQLLADVPLVTTTLIRDPVAMVASHYTHWRDRGNVADPLTDLARRMPFDEWCRSKDTYPLWSNPQATSLATPRVAPTRARSAVEPEGTTVPIPADLLEERAITLLDGIDVVGTTDDLLAVYRSCLQRLGIEPTHEAAVRANAGAGLAEPVSSSTSDWIMENNTIDAALFDRASARRGDLGVGTVRRAHP
jgi:hypothetical protein